MQKNIYKLSIDDLHFLMCTMRLSVSKIVYKKKMEKKKSKNKTFKYFGLKKLNNSKWYIFLRKTSNQGGKNSMSTRQKIYIRFE